MKTDETVQLAEMILTSDMSQKDKEILMIMHQTHELEQVLNNYYVGLQDSEEEVRKFCWIDSVHKDYKNKDNS